MSFKNNETFGFPQYHVDLGTAANPDGSFDEAPAMVFNFQINSVAVQIAWGIWVIGVEFFGGLY